MKNPMRRWLAGVLNLLLEEDDQTHGQPPAGDNSAAAPEQHSELPAESLPPSSEATVPAPSTETPRTPARQMEEPIPGCAACRAVILSDRAYSAICAEALYRHPDETGGVFLGQRQDGVWYIVEATDPGLDTLHTSVHHEMDDKYLNHVYGSLRRMYRNGLDLLGLWHRHPGSFDRFSANDMETNAAYAKVNGDGAISMLVNIDPDIRLTCWYCELQPDGRVRPVRVPVLVGDRHFAGTDFLTLLYPDARIQPETKKPTAYPQTA